MEIYIRLPTSARRSAGVCHHVRQPASPDRPQLPPTAASRRPSRGRQPTPANPPPMAAAAAPTLGLLRIPQNLFGKLVPPTWAIVVDLERLGAFLDHACATFKPS